MNESEPNAELAEAIAAAVSRIAVVGLGSMGSRIAGRLASAGYDVIAWNRTPGKTEALIGRGVAAAGSPAAAAREADVVITMVSDARALRDVTESPAGIVFGIAPPSTLIQMGTVGREAVLRLASVLPTGVGLLDAPVLGSLKEAETGSLRIYVGGQPEQVEQRTTVLFDLGSPMYVGPLGAGTAAKLVANAALFGVLGLLGEALLLARSSRLATDIAFDVIATTPLAAQAERRRQAIEANTYPARFALSLARRDADLIIDAAAMTGADLRLATVMRGLFTEAEDAGWGDLDYSALLARILGSSDRPIGPSSRASDARDDRSRPGAR